MAVYFFVEMELGQMRNYMGFLCFGDERTFMPNHGNKAPIIIENYTIEHIMPQNSNPSNEWKREFE